MDRHTVAAAVGAPLLLLAGFALGWTLKPTAQLAPPPPTVQTTAPAPAPSVVPSDPTPQFTLTGVPEFSDYGSVWFTVKAGKVGVADTLLKVDGLDAQGNTVYSCMGATGPLRAGKTKRVETYCDNGGEPGAKVPEAASYVVA